MCDAWKTIVTLMPLALMTVFSPKLQNQLTTNLGLVVKMIS
jgi:hypothetical protein